MTKEWRSPRVKGPCVPMLITLATASSFGLPTYLCHGHWKSIIIISCLFDARSITGSKTDSLGGLPMLMIRRTGITILLLACLPVCLPASLIYCSLAHLSPLSIPVLDNPFTEPRDSSKSSSSTKYRRILTMILGYKSYSMHTTSTSLVPYPDQTYTSKALLSSYITTIPAHIVYRNSSHGPSGSHSLEL